MSTIRVKPPMTDKLWNIHRMMAEKIKRAYFDFEAASEPSKSIFEKRLLHAITKRGQYSHKPSA